MQNSAQWTEAGAWLCNATCFVMCMPPPRIPIQSVHDIVDARLVLRVTGPPFLFVGKSWLWHAWSTICQIVGHTHHCSTRVHTHNIHIYKYTYTNTRTHIHIYIHIYTPLHWSVLILVDPYLSFDIPHWATLIPAGPHRSLVVLSCSPWIPANLSLTPMYVRMYVHSCICIYTPVCV